MIHILSLTVSRSVDSKPEVYWQCTKVTFLSDRLDKRLSAPAALVSYSVVLYDHWSDMCRVSWSDLQTHSRIQRFEKALHRISDWDVIPSSSWTKTQECRAKCRPLWCVRLFRPRYLQTIRCVTWPDCRSNEEFLKRARLFSELELRVVVHTKSLEKGFKVAL